MREYKKIYAVDFDGTLAQTRFPKIIKPNFSVFMLCRMIKKRGDILILWTCRCGKDLEDAVEYCRKYGLEFDFINENVPGNVEKFGNDCRKIFAHEYIDDKAWSPVRKRIWVRRMAKRYIRNNGLLLITVVTYMILKVLGFYKRKRGKKHGKTSTGKERCLPVLRTAAHY